MAVSPSSSSSSWSTLLETGSGIALLPEVEFVTIVVEVEGNKPTVVAVTVLDPDVEKWICDNLDNRINLKSRMAPTFLSTTHPDIQSQVIGTYINPHQGDPADTERLARAVLERVL